jgi:hypothetical protein
MAEQVRAMPMSMSMSKIDNELLSPILFRGRCGCRPRNMGGDGQVRMPTPWNCFGDELVVGERRGPEPDRKRSRP